MPSVWGDELGKGGVELVQKNETSASYTAEMLAKRQIIPNPHTESSSGSHTPAPASAGRGRKVPDDSVRMLGKEELPEDGETLADKAGRLRLEDREWDNIDITSPIRLSRQAKEVIARLRRMKDEQEDWIK
jgi:hypothetical protein